MPLDRANIVTILKRIHLFRNVEDARLDIAAGYFEAVEYPAGQILYQQRAAPDYFYIVVQGRVRLSRVYSGERATISLGLYTDDDYFGEEILEGSWPRQVTAEIAADGGATLLRIPVQGLASLLEIIPDLGKRLQFILDSYKLMVRTHFPWRDADESVLFIARRHILFLFAKLLPALATSAVVLPALFYMALTIPLLMIWVVMGVGILLALAWLVWSYVDWANDYYVVTCNRVVFQERVVLFYDSRQESPLSAIQSTTTNTSQWGRWLGYGNVAIRTFYGTLLFRSIPYPEQVMTFIQQEQLRAQFQQRAMSIQDISAFIDRRIRLGPQRPSLPAARKPPEKHDPLRAFLSSMFHLRYQTGRTIIYRTHWFILLGKIIAPTLLLFGTGAVFIASLANRFALLSVQATCGLTFMASAGFFLWWLYQYMDWHNDRYIITIDQVVDVNKKPLGHEERQAAPIKNILSIEYKRIGLLGLILNYGTVYIRVGDRQLTFDEVYKPSEVQRELFHRLAEVSAEEKKAQAEQDKQRFGDWFASYHQWQRGHNRGPEAPGP
jgi:hypothetical protein